ALRPDAYQPHVNLARAYEGARDLAAAVGAMDAAVGCAPEAALLYSTRARLHLRLGHAAAARRDLEQAIARDTSGRSLRLAEDHVDRGRLLQKDRDSPAALAAHNTALKLVADFPPAHRYRAEALLALGHDAEAVQALDRFLAVGGKPSAEVHE